MTEFKPGDRVRLIRKDRITAREARRVHAVLQAELGPQATSVVLIEWSHLRGYRTFVQRSSIEKVR